MSLENPSHEAEREYASSKRVTAPLVDQIVAQLHQPPDESHIKSAQQAVRKERVQECEERAERIRESAYIRCGFGKRIIRVAHSTSPKRTGIQLE